MPKIQISQEMASFITDYARRYRMGFDQAADKILRLQKNRLESQKSWRQKAAEGTLPAVRIGSVLAIEKERLP